MSRRQLQPYPGLRPFERYESKVFFGRQQQVDELLQRLKKQKFLAVLGASGSGKSSLVRAGLLPGLEKGYMGEIGSRWRIAELRPGDAPFERLAEGLGEQPQFLAAQLRRGSRSLHTLLAQSPLKDGEKLLILVDQFEEIFRYRQQAGNQAAAFVALLLEACEHPDIFVVITMRSDFLGDAAAFYGLPEAINDGLYLTPRLTREQLQQAIALPARLFGGGVDDALVNQLVNEAGNNPDQLPLLQHALMRMWVEDEDKQLTLQEYRALDGLRGALDGHLEKVFSGLSAEQQRIAEVMFRALTERSAEGQATRRPVMVSEVLAVADCTLDELATVVAAFSGPGRHFLMTSTPELTAETVLDISHESLIRQWQRLLRWVEDEAAKVDTYRRLVDAAQRYANEQGELWRGTDLALGLDWQRDKTPDTSWAARYNSHNEHEFDAAIKFLVNSEEAAIRHQKAEEEKRKAELSQVRRQRAVVLLGFVLMSILAIWGLLERDRAEGQTEIAKVAEEIRTKQLFDSDTTHASLLTQIEDFAGAREKLNKTRDLDDKVTPQRRHARDLLAGFVEIMAGEAQRTFTDEGGKPLPALTGNVAISPDGQWLAASGERGTIALFERESGRLVQKLVGHNSVGEPSTGETTVRDIVFHPEQPWLFSAGDDGKILWWHLPQAGKEAVLLNGWSVDAGAVKSLALTPNGKVLASGHDDGGIRLWLINQPVTSEPSARQPIRVLEGHSMTIGDGGTNMAFSPDNQTLASASHDQTIRLWNWKAGKTRHILNGHNSDATGVAFSPGSKLLASSSFDQSIILWDVESGRGLRRLKGHQNMIFGLQFLNKDLLASASSDNTIRLWDVETGVTRQILQGHTAAVAGLASYTQAEETLLYSNSNDGTVKQWRGDLPGQWLVDLSSESSAAAISPNGEVVAIAYASGNLELYRLEDKTLLYKAEAAHSSDVNRLAFNSDGTMLASAGGNNAKLWEVTSDQLKEKQTFSGHEQMIYAITFSPDNTQLATASYDGQIGLFNLNSDEKILFKAHKSGSSGGTQSVSFSPDGKQLFSTGYYDQQLKLWDLTTQSPTATTLVTANDALLWASFSPDGTQLASVGRGGTVTIYPTQGNSKPLALHGHEQTVYKAIFSPDSRQLATMAADATVRLWDLDTQSELFRLRLPSDRAPPVPAWDFDFRCTPTGCWIAVPLTSGKLALYNLGKINYDDKD